MSSVSLRSEVARKEKGADPVPGLEPGCVEEGPLPTSTAAALRRLGHMVNGLPCFGLAGCGEIRFAVPHNLCGPQRSHRRFSKAAADTKRDLSHARGPYPLACYAGQRWIRSQWETISTRFDSGSLHCHALAAFLWGVGRARRPATMKRRNSQRPPK